MHLIILIKETEEKIILKNNKSTNYKINLDDIHKIKYTIQNLSNREINNLPISIFKEMKELYDLIYIKFLKDNCI